MTGHSKQAAISRLWVGGGLLCFWTGVIAFALLLLFGCASATGHARSGGTEIGSTVVQPDTFDAKIHIFGRVPTPEELSVLQRFGQPEVKK